MYLTTYKYQLDSSSKKYNCPSCGKKKYVRYVDEYKQCIEYQYGRCDREVNCGYFVKPDFKSKCVMRNTHVTHNTHITHVTHSSQSLRTTYITNDKLKGTFTQYKSNNFVKYLVTLFGQNIAGSLVKRFYIGTSKGGATVYWQIDNKGKIRQAKVILYDPETGRRNKDKGTWFVGKKLMGKDANFSQCFYGLHQLREDSKKTVALVESEKTAILATVYMPQYIWLASGGKHGARLQDQAGLKGRSIILFPDLGCYDDWQEKAKQLDRMGCSAKVSSYLKEVATDTEKGKGFDIADYLVKQDDSYKCALTEDKYPVMWDHKL